MLVNSLHGPDCLMVYFFLCINCLMNVLQLKLMLLFDGIRGSFWVDGGFFCRLGLDPSFCLINLTPYWNFSPFFEFTTYNVIPFQMRAVGFALPENTVDMVFQLGLLRGKACITLLMNSVNVYDDWKVSYMGWNKTGITHWKFHTFYLFCSCLFAGSYIAQFWTEKCFHITVP